MKNRKQQIRETLKKPEAEKDSKLQLALLNDLGNVLFMANEWDEACDLAKETIAIHEKSGDKAALSAALGNLGSIFMQKQDYAKSEENYARAIELSQFSADKYFLGCGVQTLFQAGYCCPGFPGTGHPRGCRSRGGP